MNLRPAQTAQSLPSSYRLRPCAEHASLNLQAVCVRSEMSGETMSNIHTVRFREMGGYADCNLCHDSLPVSQPLLFVFSCWGFFFGRAGLHDPTLAFLYARLCASHFLKVPYAIVSFTPKEHTDVGVAVKWPNKPE